jgi:hypothetical protein
MTAPDIQTARLLLRPLRMSDAEAITEIYSFEEVRDQLFVYSSAPDP